MSVLSVNKTNFEKEVINSKDKVIVDFYANWCMPCKMMSPILEEISEELGERVKVVKIDLDDNIDLAEEYNIMNIPTIMIFNNGEVIETFEGVTDKQTILDVINNSI